jgi:hypothetical protein
VALAALLLATVLSGAASTAPASAAQTYVGTTVQPLPFGDATTAGQVSLAANAQFVGMAVTPDSKGYWLAGADGGVFAYGDAGFFGSAGALPLNQPIVAIAATPDGQGYWLVASDGGVFAYGDAGFYGSMGGRPLNALVNGIASTPDGKGYWLVAGDGGVFAFGDATFYGSASTPAAPVGTITGIAPAGGGHGYWLVGATGLVLSYGDAENFGSVPNDLEGGSYIDGIAATPDSGGYWLVGTDGGVFAFGDAPFEGSLGGQPLFSPVVALAPTHDGRGYWLLTATPIPPAGVPVLGRPGSPYAQGLGLVAPRNIYLGGDATTVASDIQWGSWGGTEAVGTASAIYVAPDEFIYQGSRQPAVIVAYDLGTCSGVLMYQMVTWYFPQFGGSFTSASSPNFC